MNILRALFAPDTGALPEIVILPTPLSVYDELTAGFTAVAA